MPPVPGLPDMVFTGNAALVIDRQVLLARFRHAERRRKQAHGRALFAQLRARALVDGLHASPEGAASKATGMPWSVPRAASAGWATARARTRAPETPQAVALRPVLALERVDPRLHHLDTCLSLLTPCVCWRCGGASRRRDDAGQDIACTQLVEVPDGDAQPLAADAVCIGCDPVMGDCSATLRQHLEERGYRARVVPLDASRRSGGSARCLALELGT